jgi:acyl-coenzyme A thioesterase PaaI-like protein
VPVKIVCGGVGRIVDARGKLYAHGTTTCIVVDA